MADSESVLSRAARTAVASIDPAIASAETMKKPVVGETLAIVTPYLPDGLPIDFDALLETLVILLSGSKSRIIAGDNTYRAVRASKNKHGIEVRSLTRRAISAGRRVRTDFRRHYGSDVLVDILMSEAPDPKRFELQEQLRQFTDILKDFNPEDYEPLESMGHIDIAAKVTFLEDFATHLTETQKNYELAVKETEKQRLVLQRTIRAERQVSVHAIGMLESIYRMAGFAAEADRLRYLIRRSTRSRQREEIIEPEPGEVVADEIVADEVVADEAVSVEAVSGEAVLGEA